MKYLTSGPSGVLSISYHGLCIFTKLKISWQVLLGMLKKSQESHLSTKIGSHLFFEDVLVDWVSSFFSFQLLARDTLCVFAAPIQGESTRCLLSTCSFQILVSHTYVVCMYVRTYTSLVFFIYPTMLFLRILLLFLNNSSNYFYLKNGFFF